MDSQALQSWIQTIGGLLLSWPVIVLVIVLIFRKPLLRVLDRFIGSEAGRAKVGPVEIELGKLAQKGQSAVEGINRLSEIMAESRLLELEITSSMFGSVLTDSQRKQMQSHIQQLKSLTKKDSVRP